MSERRAEKILLPLSAEHGKWAALTAAWPMSEEDWQQMMATLEVMKRCLVVTPDADAATGRERGEP